MTAAQPVRVLIADDDGATRAGVRMSLSGQGFEVCAEAGSASAALEAALRERPDICLLEADLPGRGVVAAEAIAEGLPRAVIVMLSATVDEERLFAALRAGARGYL